MLIIGIVVAFIVIGLLDLRSLFRSNHIKKTILVYLFLLSTGFVISIIQVIGMEAPPSPAVYIEKMIKTIGRVVGL